MRFDNADRHDPENGSMTMFYTTNSQGEGRVSTRYLLRDPMQGWVRLAKAKVEAITNCELTMPEYAGLTIDIACAYVEMLFKKPIRLVRLERDTWPFTTEGIYDEKLVREWIQYKLADDSIGVQEPCKGNFEDDEEKAIRKALEITL